MVDPAQGWRTVTTFTTSEHTTRQRPRLALLNGAFAFRVGRDRDRASRGAY